LSVCKLTTICSAMSPIIGSSRKQFCSHWHYCTSSSILPLW
jgi:hypothetical protein